MGIIGTIRKHSWVAVAIVGIAIIAFIIGDLSKNNNNVPDVGVINGTTLTYNRFNELIEEAELNYKRQQNVAQIPSEVENQLREQVWQQFVMETLTDEQFAKLGLTVSPAELNDMYAGTFIHPYIRQSFTDPQTGVFNTEAVQYYVDHFDELDTAQRLQWMDLEKFVKADRKQQKYSNLLSRGFYMPNAIAKQIAALDSKMSDANSVCLSYQSVAPEEITLTEEDYKNYYNKHQKEFRVPEELRMLDYIVYPIVPTAKDMADIQASVEETWAQFQQEPADDLIFFVNAESDRSYDSTYMQASAFASPMDSAIMAAGEGSFISPRVVGNEWQMAKVLKVANRPDSLRASSIYIFNSMVGGDITRSDDQAKALADSVLALVKGGMSFEEAVQKYSDDPQKAQNNGDMEWQLDGSYGFLNEQLVENPEGSVFVVRHPNEIGYFVVKVTGKTAMHKKYRVAVIARGINASDATNRAIFAEANKFAGNNRTAAEMTAAAQAENLQVRNAMVNAMSYNLNNIANARSIIQWAYNEKTEMDAVADQVFEADDQYVVVALKDIYKQGYATLEQVRPNIESQVRVEKMGEILSARLEEAKKAGSNLSSIAAKLNVSVDTLDSISFNGYHMGAYGMEPKLQAAVVTAEANTLVGPVVGANGVYMFQVNNQYDNPNATAAEAVRGQQQQKYMMKLRYIQTALTDNAKIVDQRNKFF